MDKKEIKHVSVFEFIRVIPDEDAAEAFVAEARWGDVPRCPRCDSDRVSRPKNRHPAPYRCRACRKHFSAKTDTVMAQSQVTLRKWLLAVWLFHTARKGISSLQLHKELEVTYETAWFLEQRIREAMRPNGPLLAGVVEIDEAYVGGDNKWRHGDKRIDGGTKVPVLGFRERENGRIVAFPIDRVDRYTLLLDVMGNVEPDATIYTDGSPFYRNIPAYDHHSVNHRQKEFVRGDVTTNSIESFWSLIKRGYHGTFHHWSDKHMHRYVNEFAYRVSAGPGSGWEEIRMTVANMVGKRLTYEQLTEGPPAYSERRATAGIPLWLEPAGDSGDLPDEGERLAA